MFLFKKIVCFGLELQNDYANNRNEHKTKTVSEC